VIALVCGGRDFKDRNLVWRVLDMMLIDLLVHGGCKSGADFFADLWARNRRQRVKEYPAEWEKFGNRAGPLRNAFMFEDAKPNVVVAFPGGVGTKNMLAIVDNYNVEHPDRVIPIMKVNW
jgi:hypothetical protein